MIWVEVARFSWMHTFDFNIRLVHCDAIEVERLLLRDFRAKCCAVYQRELVSQNGFHVAGIVGCFLGPTVDVEENYQVVVVIPVHWPRLMTAVVNKLIEGKVAPFEGDDFRIQVNVFHLTVAEECVDLGLVISRFLRKGRALQISQNGLVPIAVDDAKFAAVRVLHQLLRSGILD